MKGSKFYCISYWPESYRGGQLTKGEEAMRSAFFAWLVFALLAPKAWAQEPMAAGEQDTSGSAVSPKVAGSFLLGVSRTTPIVHTMPGVVLGSGSRIIDRRVSLGAGIGAQVGVFKDKPDNNDSYRLSLAMAFVASVIIGQDRMRKNDENGLTIAYVYTNGRLATSGLSSHGIMVGVSVWRR